MPEEVGQAPTRPADRYAHLRACASARAGETVRRTAAAIAVLTDPAGPPRPVTGASIKAAGGPDYMVIRRNPEAYALYLAHATPSVGRPSRPRQGTTVPLERDPLRALPRERLARDLRRALEERDVARVAWAGADERYRHLLAIHVGCAERIARIEAALANQELRARIADLRTLEGTVS